MPSESSIRRFFAAYEKMASDDIAHEFESLKERRYQPFLWFIGHRTSRRVLEIGCGRGVVLSLSRARMKVGIDVALPYLREFGDGADRVQALAELLPFPDLCFDTVIADAVLEHVIDLRAVLMEIHRVLEKGGSLFATVPYREEDYAQKYKWQLEKYGWAEHLRTFDEESEFPGFRLERLLGLLPNIRTDQNPLCTSFRSTHVPYVRLLEMLLRALPSVFWSSVLLFRYSDRRFKPLFPLFLKYRPAILMLELKRDDGESILGSGAHRPK